MTAQILQHPRFARAVDAGMVRNVRIFVDNLISFYGADGAAMLLRYELMRLEKFEKAGSGV